MSKTHYPEPTVGGLILNTKNEVLLVKSHKWKDMYTMPGGHIELGEKIEDTLKREMKEETGLDVYDPKFICYQEYIQGEHFWKKKHFIFLDFACRSRSEKVTLNNEAQEYVWMKPEIALGLQVEPYTKHAIMEYLRQI